jgi:hypothetical protein
MRSHRLLVSVPGDQGRTNCRPRSASLDRGALRHAPGLRLCRDQRREQVGQETFLRESAATTLIAQAQAGNVLTDITPTDEDQALAKRLCSPPGKDDDRDDDHDADQGGDRSGGVG